MMHSKYRILQLLVIFEFFYFEAERNTLVYVNVPAM